MLFRSLSFFLSLSLSLSLSFFLSLSLSPSFSLPLCLSHSLFLLFYLLTYLFCSSPFFSLIIFFLQFLSYSFSLFFFFHFLGLAGACENIIIVLQKHAANMAICTEVCWAIRNMAQTGQILSYFIFLINIDIIETWHKQVKYCHILYF